MLPPENDFFLNQNKDFFRYGHHLCMWDLGQILNLVTNLIRKNKGTFVISILKDDPTIVPLFFLFFLLNGT